MLVDSKQKMNMPDVTKSEKTLHQSALKWVGMEKVAVPLQIKNLGRTTAEADIFVNLAQPEAKGIHMSRLYLALQDGFLSQELSGHLIGDVLTNFVESQKGLANAARMVLRWQELHSRKALLSEYHGWKTYPVEIIAEKNEGQLQITLKLSVFYSSACPCSAALARQLYQQAFQHDFQGDQVKLQDVVDWLGKTPVATSHSQRSRADVEILLNPGHDKIEFLPYIDALENGLGTPVQTAVKREDEQEFARLNGEKSMFVEDALRVMKKAMSEFAEVQSFVIKTHHFESLHAHDAVGVISS